MTNNVCKCSTEVRDNQPRLVDNDSSQRCRCGPLELIWQSGLCRLRCKKVPYDPSNFLIAPGSVHYHDIHEFQEREKERLQNRETQNFHHERDFLLFFKGKCTPLNFTWKAEAVKNKIAESAVNVGKLMRVHIVQQIQGLYAC